MLNVTLSPPSLQLAFLQLKFCGYLYLDTVLYMHECIQTEEECFQQCQN